MFIFFIASMVDIVQILNINLSHGTRQGTKYIRRLRSQYARKVPGLE